MAYCCDDIHVATGHSCGVTTIVKMDYTTKSARISSTMAAASNRSTSVSTAMRCVQFQVKLSPAVNKTLKFTRGASTTGRIAVHAPLAQRANTAPSVPLSTLLLNIPEKGKEDSRHNPRDSALFSPEVSGGRNNVLRTQVNASLVRNPSEDYGDANGRKASGVDSYSVVGWSTIRTDRAAGIWRAIRNRFLMVMLWIPYYSARLGNLNL